MSDIVRYRKKAFCMPKTEINKYLLSPILRNLLITDVGCYEKAVGHYAKRTVFPEYQMIYCIAGSGYIEQNGALKKVGEGNILFCLKDLPHIYYSDENDPWSILLVHFLGDYVTEFFNLIDITADSPIIYIGRDSKIINYFYEIFQLLENGHNQYSVISSATCLQQIFSRILLHNMNINLNFDYDVTIQNVIEYMNKNINTSVTLDQLSNYAGISKYGFVRRFKQKVGYSPMDYYNRLRVQKACEFLKLTNLSINEISSRLGYNNPYYFSAAFKNIVGISPNRFRQEHAHLQL